MERILSIIKPQMVNGVLLNKMAQKLAIGGLSGSGVGAVLIISGIALKATDVSKGMGDFAIFAGIAFLVIFGLLGIIGIISRYK